MLNNSRLNPKTEVVYQKKCNKIQKPEYGKKEDVKLIIRARKYLKSGAY